jgi:predicted phosphodiesterase
MRIAVVSDIHGNLRAKVHQRAEPVSAPGTGPARRQDLG